MSPTDVATAELSLPHRSDLLLLTPSEVARLLRVTPRTVQRWSNDGKLERVRLGRRVVRYTAGSVERLISPSETASPEATTPGSPKMSDDGAQGQDYPGSGIPYGELALADAQLERLADLIADRIAARRVGELVDAANSLADSARAVTSCTSTTSASCYSTGDGPRPRLAFRWPDALDLLLRSRSPRRSSRSVRGARSLRSAPNPRQLLTRLVCRHCGERSPMPGWLSCRPCWTGTRRPGPTSFRHARASRSGSPRPANNFRWRSRRRGSRCDPCRAGEVDRW